jgi:uncharacterized membrane protein
MMSVPKMLRHEQLASLCSIACISFLVLTPLLFNGIPTGYDLPHHYQCAMTFVESIRAGDLYPSWSLNRNLGYGGMEMRLYPPVSHYTLAVFYLATNSWFAATFLTLYFFTFIGSLGIYLWAKEYVRPTHAAFAGCVFVVLPYHLNQIYNTFLYAEYVGTSILPFVFLFAARVCRRGRISDVIGLGVSYAVLLLTHLPLAVIGSLSLGVFALFSLKRHALVKTSLKLAGSLFLGLAGSAFFIAKVLQEKQLLAKTTIYQEDWIDYRLHFLISGFQNSASGMEANVYENAIFMYELIFWCLLLVAGSFSIPVVRSSWAKFKDMRGVITVLLLTIILVTPLSRGLWDRLQFLQEIQFPWRWLAITSVVVPILAAGGVETFTVWFRSKMRPLALIMAGCIAGVTVFSVFQIIRPAPYIAPFEIESTMQAAATSSGFNFWWTPWARKAAFEVTERVSSSGRSFRIDEWTAETRRINVDDGEAGSVRLAVLYHPNWRAEVNDVPVSAFPDENGALMVPIGGGMANVRVSFVEGAAVSVAGWLSLAFWMGLMLIVAFDLKSRLHFRLSTKGNESAVQRSGQIISWARVGIARSATKHVTLTIAFISLVAVLPTLYGVFDGGDLPIQTQFANTFYTAILGGDPYPSWAANENLGYGSLGSRLYPPAIPMAWGLFRFALGSWPGATFLNFFLLALVSTAGVYFLAREYCEKGRALITAAIFAVMPYHLMQIYNASMYGEYAACGLVAFCLAFVRRLCRGGTWSDVVRLGIAYAALVYTHLPLAVIGSITILVFLASTVERRLLFSTLMRAASGLTIGLLASSAYWATVLLERDWMRNTRFWKDDHFQYQANFLFTSPWFNNYYTWERIVFIWATLFSLTLPFIVAVYCRNGERSRRLRPLAIIFSLAMIMSTVVSKPIWDVIPLLGEVQFPWRWLAIGSIASALLVSNTLTATLEVYADGGIKKFVIQVCVIALLISAPLAVRSILIEYSRGTVDLRSLDNWIPTEAQKLGIDMFWTIDANEEAFQIQTAVTSSRSVQVNRWEPEDRSFTVAAGSETQIRIATLFYPRWAAYVNGVESPLSKAPDGSMFLSVPTGEAEVKLQFKEPFSLTLATIVSATMCVGMLVVLTLLNWRRLRFGLPYRRSLVPITQ